MEVKELILDYSKWRCGNFGWNQLGRGETYLLNNEGFMCCLGQFCQQLGISIEALLNNAEPEEVCNAEYDLFVYKDESRGICNTFFTRKLIGINDDRATTPEQKIHSIKSLLAEEGIELKVINKP